MAKNYKQVKGKKKESESAESHFVILICCKAPTECEYDQAPTSPDGEQEHVAAGVEAAAKEAE